MKGKGPEARASLAFIFCGGAYACVYFFVFKVSHIEGVGEGMLGGS